MSFRSTSSTRWRGRAIAVAGIAAAATVGGLALATAAEAATAPTLTISAPAQVVNNGAIPTTPLAIDLDNTGTGHSVIPPSGGTADLSVTITGVSGLACANIALLPELTGPTTAGVALSPTMTLASGTNGTCVFHTGTTFTQADNSQVTYNYGLSVNASTQTGTLSSTANLLVKDSGANIVTNLTSNTATTSLVAPTALTAPTFATAAPPAATIFQPYSFQEATSVGNPAATFYAFYRPTSPDSSGVYECGDTGTRSASWSVYNKSTQTWDAAIYLNDGFYFDTVTGFIVNNNPDYADSTPPLTWTIIANNGQGGAAAPGTTGIGCGGTAAPTPSLSTNAVASPTFQLPILFKDVSLTSTFANEIYTLASEGIINGYADGTFRPAASVSRQAFAALLAREIFGGYSSSATCSTFHPSPFSDVPDASPFCQEIRDLASAGIINGYSDGTFHPSATITRQAVAALLYRAHAYNVGAEVADQPCSSPIPFNDVTASNPFCGDIEWMASNHYANGYADGGFHPTANVSRQATAAFIYRIFES